MDVTEDSRALNPQPAPAADPAPATPRAALRTAAVGIPIALLAGAAVSFQGLAGLGTLVGIRDPWLLPIAIDVYAATSTLITLFLPEGHRARTTALWNARLGLAMSMSGNAAFRAMHLGVAGYTVSDGVLTFVGSWPSLIVERLLHLQGRLTGTPSPVPLQPPTEPAETVPAQPRNPPAAPLEPARNRSTATVPHGSNAPIGTARTGSNATRTRSAATMRVPKQQQLRIVRALVEQHGPDVPLSTIRERLDCSKATASRVRAEVTGAEGNP
jgi:hypothetical protein